MWNHREYVSFTVFGVMDAQVCVLMTVFLFVCLCCLVNQHVNMKVVVATELEKLLHRPNIRPKAQYVTSCIYVWCG